MSRRSLLTTAARIRLVTGVVILALLAWACWFAGSAHAADAAGLAHHHHRAVVATDVTEFIKGWDLGGYTSDGITSEGFTAAAQADGITLPQVQHIGCGQWTDPGGVTHVLGQSDGSSCNSWGSAATPIFENFLTFQGSSSLTRAQRLHASLRAQYESLVRAVGLGMPYKTIMIDDEGWIFTPAGQFGNPSLYLPQTLSFAAAHGISVIFTTNGPNAANAFDLAIENGAWAVSIQSQGYGTAGFDAGLGAMVTDLRVAKLDYGSSTDIWFGVGTNTATPNTGQTLANEYQYAQTLGLSKAWVNGANWGAKNQCTSSMGGPGCPDYFLWMLHDLGLVPTP
jgi:hypothetical protein